MVILLTPRSMSAAPEPPTTLPAARPAKRVVNLHVGRIGGESEMFGQQCVGVTRQVRFSSVPNQVLRDSPAEMKSRTVRAHLWRNAACAPRRDVGTRAKPVADRDTTAKGGVEAEQLETIG